MEQISRTYFGSWLMALVAAVGFTSAAAILLGYVPVSAYQARDIFMITVAVGEIAASAAFAYRMNWFYAWGFWDKEKKALLRSFAKVSVLSTVMFAGYVDSVLDLRLLSNTWDYLNQPISLHITLPSLPVALTYIGAIVVLALTVGVIVAIALATFGLKVKDRAFKSNYFTWRIRTR